MYYQTRTKKKSYLTNWVGALIHNYNSFIWLVNNCDQMATQYLNCVITMNDFLDINYTVLLYCNDWVINIVNILVSILSIVMKPCKQGLIYNKGPFKILCDAFLRVELCGHSGIL